MMENSYEYDCPMFVDFTQPLEIDAQADEYFNFDHENGTPVFGDSSVGKTPKTPDNQTPRRNPSRQARGTPTTNTTPLKDSSNLTPGRRMNTSKQVASEKENPMTTKDKPEAAKKSHTPPSKPPVKRLARSNSARCASSKPAVSKRTVSLERPARQRPVGKSPEQRSRKVSVEVAPKKGVGSASLNETRKRLVAPPHQRSLSACRHNQSRRRSTHSRSLSMEPKKPSLNTTKEDNNKHAPAKRPKCTVPSTPSVLKHPTNTSATTDVKTTEEREMEEIKRLRKELALKKKKAEESHKMALAGASHVPLRAQLPTTKADSFLFATDKRIKNQGGEPKVEAESKDFQATLRKQTPVEQKSQQQAPRKTIPAPFSLHDKKRKREEEPASCSSRYKSMAEQLRDFSRKTPDRFRSKPKPKDGSLTPQKKRPCPESKLTMAKTPNLETRSRHRPAAALSQAQLEEMLIEEIKKNQFKAHPVNEHILRNPNSGVHRVTPKGTTQFEEFDLESNRRPRTRSDHAQEESHYEFHANPVPTKILKGTVGVKRVIPGPITKPESPAFALKNRLRSFKQQVEDQSSQSNMASVPKAKPVPHLGIPFAPVLDHRVTEVQAFSFETRDQQRRRKKEEKIQKVFEQEKKLREFHANPLPSDLADPLPCKKAKPSTLPEPFQFEADARGNQKAEQWEHKMEEELRQQRSQVAFKAKPPVSLLKQPFVPKKSNKHTTDLQDFSLSTERRTERWAELERQKLEKEVELDRQQREAERMKREAEEREIRRLRKSAVHKASGIRQYKPVDPRPSDIQLTQPETPRFSDRLKSRVAGKS